MVPFFHATAVVKLHQWILALVQARTSNYLATFVDGYFYIVTDIRPEDNDYIAERMIVSS